MAQSHSSTPRPARADISKDTQMCISLSARPSNIGTRFHNYLYAELGLDYIYKACTTTDLAAAIGGIRALGIRGCGVSMPFKEESIRHVDTMDASASAIGSVNTIVNTAGHLAAYNTDYLAIAPRCWPNTRCRQTSPSPSPGAAGWPRQWSQRCATAISAP